MKMADCKLRYNTTPPSCGLLVQVQGLVLPTCFKSPLAKSLQKLQANVLVGWSGPCILKREIYEKCQRVLYFRNRQVFGHE